MYTIIYIHYRRIYMNLIGCVVFPRTRLLTARSQFVFFPLRPYLYMHLCIHTSGSLVPDGRGLELPH